MALTQFFQIAITHTGAGADASTLETTKPAAPVHNPNLIRHQLELLQYYFPQLSSRASATSHTLIAQGLGVIAIQQQQHHDELLVVKNASKTNPVEKWLGINKLHHLLGMLLFPNESALEVTYPVYEVMALAPNALKMGELQDAIDTEIVTRRKKYTDFVLSDVIYSNFTSLRWGHISDDSI